MPIIPHQNSALTICQKYFIEKSIELLYLGSIDSYRVKLNNPKSILEELRYCLHEFGIGRIRHFQTIKAKDGKHAVIDEAIYLLASKPNYLVFSSISEKYIELLLKKTDENNYKKLKSSVDILLQDNGNYLSRVIDGLEILINSNVYSVEELEKIDKTLNILFSELINQGYSKGFLYKLLYGIFVSSLVPETTFIDHFNNFKQRISSGTGGYTVVFRIDTTQKVYDSISTIPHHILTLSDNINEIALSGRQAAELASFNSTGARRKFIRCNVNATDYLAALKKGRSTLSEYLDVINLGLSDEFLQIHHRALVIDLRSPERGDFQNNINILDGKYKVAKRYYFEFTQKLPIILGNDKVANETKEKIKSAIRYLRLGNQSTEVEHKFINYWIGLEYIFSNYESHSTINRLKDHFINAHSLAYVKRNVYALEKAVSELSTYYQSLIPAYTPHDTNCWKSNDVYVEIETQLLYDYPLLSYRAMRLKKTFFNGRTPNAVEYLKHHKINLEIHFTRIYRLRNEIIHDAATNTNNEQIASNLRYYLTFILNELIDFLFRISDKEISIEDYFILNEIKIGNIEHNGFLLNELLDVECTFDFMS